MPELQLQPLFQSGALVVAVGLSWDWFPFSSQICCLQRVPLSVVCFQRVPLIKSATLELLRKSEHLLLFESLLDAANNAHVSLGVLAQVLVSKTCVYSPPERASPDVLSERVFGVSTNDHPHR